jgi:hypothetical protein
MPGSGPRLIVERVAIGHRSHRQRRRTGLGRLTDRVGHHVPMPTDDVVAIDRLSPPADVVNPTW